MFKNIILAVDGSGHAAKAAQTAADMAAKYGAGLTIVTVLPSSLTLEEVESMPQAGRFPQNVKDDIKRFRDVLTRSTLPETRSSIISAPAPPSAIGALGEEILNEAEAAARSKGVSEIKRLALDGHPAEAIAEAAEQIGADLIVMGTRGLTDFQGMFMGSVSHKVLHVAQCPCLLVR